MEQSGRPTHQNRQDRTLSFFTKLIATGLFSGYIPFASGTFGTIVGMAIYLIPGFEEPVVLGGAIVLFFFIGVVTSAQVACSVGHQLNRDAAAAKKVFQAGKHETPDPSIVVIDEIVGIWIAVLFMPKSTATVAGAFILFRILDIIKPYPAAQVERIPNGWGIMLDDVIAGIYTCVVLHLVRFVIPSLFV